MNSSSNVNSWKRTRLAVTTAIQIWTFEFYYRKGLVRVMRGYRAKDKAPVLKISTNLFLSGSRKRKLTENPFWVNNSLAWKLILIEKQILQATPALAAASLLLKRRNRKRPNEARNSLWWENGYRNWTDEQFKKRLRICRATFQSLLAFPSETGLQKPI